MYMGHWSKKEGFGMGQETKYSFRKLWHILVDKNMTKQELAKKAGISISSLARLKKGYPLSYDRMQRICEVIGVEDISDILEEIEDKN